MTQVGELERRYRELVGRLDRPDVPWEDAEQAWSQAWELGEDMLKAPAEGLDDVAVKIRWLIHRDLDELSMKRALECVLRDLGRLGAH